jgi:glyoxylase-like metal-dependent hydrolase (beta-lactamase superfamily II)
VGSVIHHHPRKLSIRSQRHPVLFAGDTEVLLHAIAMYATGETSPMLTPRAACEPFSARVAPTQWMERTPLLFRQLFERESSTYTYLLARRRGGAALLIDPVKQAIFKYLQLIEELDLRLVFAVDTHIHADHVTALGGLRDATGCTTIMGAQSRAECVSRRVVDGESIQIDGVELRALHTPGHTDDSYSFLMSDRVFTGDTLLIRGTGRTDFQNGDPHAQYDSLFGKLLKLPDETLVYPAHDYKGWTVSTIGEEKAHNPRLKVGSKDQYVRLMRGLKLPNPRLMDIAVPANLSCGLP